MSFVDFTIVYWTFDICHLVISHLAFYNLEKNDMKKLIQLIHKTNIHSIFDSTQDMADMASIARNPSQVVDMKNKFCGQVLRSVNNHEKICILSSNEDLIEQIKRNVSVSCKDVKIWTKTTPLVPSLGRDCAPWMNPKFNIVICAVEDFITDTATDFTTAFYNGKAVVFDTLYVYGEAVNNNIRDMMSVIHKVTSTMKGRDVFIALDAVPVKYIPKKNGFISNIPDDARFASFFNQMAAYNEIEDKMRLTAYDTLFMRMLTQMGAVHNSCNTRMLQL